MLGGPAMTEDERLFRIFQTLGDLGGESRHLCETSARVIGVTGAGIMLIEPGHGPMGSACSSDAVSARLESLQFSLVEGPCIDAHSQGTVVSEPDLAAPERSRWAGFTPSAVAAGARAIFGIPMRLGEVRLGALNLYQDRPGELSSEQLADAGTMAGVAARLILETAARREAQSSGGPLGQGAELHLVVHQAAGMVSVQLAVGVSDAMARLRAAAFSAGRSVDEVAADVVDRRLRFRPEPEP